MTYSKIQILRHNSW